MGAPKMNDDEKLYDEYAEEFFKSLSTDQSLRNEFKAALVRLMKDTPHIKEMIQKNGTLKKFDLVKILDGFTKTVKNIFFKSKSPLGLTDLGLLLLEESGGKKFIDDKKEILIKQILALKPKTKFDVQEFSIAVLERHRVHDDFIIILEYIYDKGLDYGDVLKTLSLYLRDLALVEWEKHQKYGL